jgi:nitrogen regulatory protein P-II 1
MKKIEAIIKPFKLGEVRDALSEAGIEDMTISEVKGFGRQNTHMESHRGRQTPVDFLPKMKIELVLPDDRLDRAVAAIAKVVKTAKIGDANVFVSNIEDALEEHAEQALEFAH